MSKINLKKINYDESFLETLSNDEILQNTSIKQIITLINSLAKTNELFLLEEKLTQIILKYLSLNNLTKSQKQQAHFLLFKISILTYNLDKSLLYYNFITTNYNCTKAFLFKLDNLLAILYFNLSLYRDAQEHFNAILQNSHFKKLSLNKQKNILFHLATAILHQGKYDFNYTYDSDELNDLASHIQFYFKIIKNANSKQIKKNLREYEEFIKCENNSSIVNFAEINLLIAELLIENNMLLTAENLLTTYLQNTKLTIFTKIKVQSLLQNIYKVNNLPKFLKLLPECENSQNKLSAINLKIINNYMKISSNIVNLKNELKEKEDFLKIDSLTKCFTRDTLMETTYNFKNGYGAVVFFDLNNLKAYNDTMGHLAGDIYITTFAKILLKFKSQNINIYRMGGDEFLLIAQNHNYDDINQLIKKIVTASGKPIKILNKKVNLSYSVGISLFPKDATDLNKLIILADKAMYKSKQSKHNELITINYSS